MWDLPGPEIETVLIPAVAGGFLTTAPPGKSLFIFNFIFGCIVSSLPCVGPLQLWWAGATPCRGARAFYCSGLPGRGARAPGAQASAAAACKPSSHDTWAPECRPSSCGAGAQPLRSTWHPPRPGPEPVSPVLAGGSPTTAPPGKSALLVFTNMYRNFPGGAVVKNPPANAGDTDSSPGPGRSHMLWSI